LDATNSDLNTAKSEVDELQKLPHRKLPPSVPHRTTTTILEELKRSKVTNHHTTQATQQRSKVTYQRINVAKQQYRNTATQQSISGNNAATQQTQQHSNVQHNTATQQHSNAVTQRNTTHQRSNAATQQHSKVATQRNTTQ
jgi:hypothetical protein